MLKSVALVAALLWARPVSAQVLPQPAAGGSSIGNFTFTSTGSKPTCNSALVLSGLGTWTTRGVAGSNDIIEVCRKIFDDTYAWSRHLGMAQETSSGRTLTVNYMLPVEWAETRVRFVGRRIGVEAEFLEYNGEAGVLELNNGSNAFYVAFGGSEMQPVQDRSVQIGRTTKRFKGAMLSEGLTTAALPTCDADSANKLTIVDGTTGVAGSVHVCLRRADGAFNWVQIAIGG
jgi:hypothetical protein